MRGSIFYSASRRHVDLFLIFFFHSCAQRRIEAGEDITRVGGIAKACDRMRKQIRLFALALKINAKIEDK